MMIGTFSIPDMADDAVVVYHSNCSDGFGAAWAFSQLAPYSANNTTYVEGQYGKDHEIPVPYAAKADLWILDFSYSFPELRTLCEEYNQVIVIDHHKTFIDSIPSWVHPDVPSNLHVVYDLERSGAGLTWDYLAQLFTPSAFKRPKLINYIEDRDIWKHELPETKAINAVIAVTPKTLKEYNELSLDLYQKFFEVTRCGELLLIQYHRIVNDIVKASRSLEIYGTAGESYRGRFSNCTGHFASDVGNKLAELSGTFGGTWCEGHDGTVKFSLRSIGDYNVEAIAKQYGGGGHKNAAGFSLGNPTPGIDGAIIWHKDPILPQGGM